MNYSTDSFIIDAGQHIQTIMFKAPTMNGAPLSYPQTMLIFNALHESVFNSIFPWANINNHPMTAIEEVYKDYRLCTVVDGVVYQCLGLDERGMAQYSKQIPYDSELHKPYIRDCFQSEHELPAVSQPGAMYLVGGDITHEPWVTYLIHSVLEPIGLELTKVIMRHAGTRRKFEWHFDYVSNGVFYTLASSRPAIVQQKVTPLSEHELINRAVLAQLTSQLPKRNTLLSDLEYIQRAFDQPAVVTRPRHNFTVDITPYTNDAAFQEVIHHAVSILSSPTYHGSQIKFIVTYSVQGYFDKLVNFINQFIETNRLDISASVKGEWVRPAIHAVPQIVDHRLQQLAVQNASVQEKLQEIRQLIVKANAVTELQGRELNDLAPEIFKMGFTPNDMAELMNVDDPTLRFYGKDPMLLDQNVLMLCLAIDRYLEGPALPQVIPVHAPPAEIPIASLNMNGLLIQELQMRLAKLDPARDDYEKARTDILQALAKLGVMS